MKRGVGALVAAFVSTVTPPLANAQHTTVAVDVSQLDQQTYDRIDALRLEKRVVVRLVQEGFAVVAVGEAPHVRITYVAKGTLLITVSVDSTHRDRSVAFADTSDLDALHLEIAQKTVELVRQMPKPANRTAITPPVLATRSPQSLPKPPASAKHRSLALEAVVGTVWRGNADAYLGVGVAHPLKSAFAITATLALIPASAMEIDVLEWEAQFGVAWIPVQTQYWSISLGVRLGALVHHFSRTGESGTRADVLVTTPVTLHRSLFRHFATAIRVAPGFTEESREHTHAGAQLWRRSNARLEVMAQLQWGI